MIFRGWFELRVKVAAKVGHGLEQPYDVKVEERVGNATDKIAPVSQSDFPCIAARLSRVLL